MRSFLAGLGLGVGLGLVLAPEKGSETRKKLKQRFLDVTEQLGQTSQSPTAVEPLHSGDDIEALEALEERPRSVLEDSDNNADPLTQILNTASKTKLMSVSGIGDATARRIIENRPYNHGGDVLEKNILSGEVLEKLKKELLEKDEEAA